MNEEEIIRVILNEAFYIHKTIGPRYAGRMGLKERLMDLEIRHLRQSNASCTLCNLSVLCVTSDLKFGTQSTR